MPTVGSNYFGVIDYVAVTLTLVGSLGIGIYHACKGGKEQTNEDLLMGGRKMSAIPIAASMLVTYFSAIAIIGYPAEIYSNGIQIFWIHVLLTGICIPLSAFIFMRVLYKLKLTSVYEYLELRFDSPTVRCLASGIFILQMTILTGVALYAPSIALHAFLGLPTWVSVVGIGVCGTIYTSIGGLKAVVWTDVFQFFLIIIGMLTIVARGFLTAGGVLPAFEKAYEHGRLELFNWTIDPFERYNTFNFVIGYGVAIVCFYGCHQPNVQRYSSLPSFREAIKAMAWNALFKEVMNVLIICTGVSLFATYAGCDPILLGAIKKADQIVPYFFINELAFIPGMMGIFTSCITSAVLSTLSSALNSLAAVTWMDFLARIPYFEQMGSAGKGRVTCVLSGLYGVATILLAFVLGRLGSIFQVTITVIGAFSGTLGGCFIMGMFLPSVNKVGAIVGMLAGLGTTGFLTFQAFLLKIPYGTLATSIDSCPNGTDFSHATNATIITTPDYEWPTKLYTVSYILYPFIGSMVTIICGLIASLLSKCFLEAPPDSCYDYLHPLVKSLCCIQTNSKSKKIKANSSSSSSSDLPLEFDSMSGKQKYSYSNNNFKGDSNSKSNSNSISKKNQKNGKGKNGIDNTAFDFEMKSA